MVEANEDQLSENPERPRPKTKQVRRKAPRPVVIGNNKADVRETRRRKEERETRESIGQENTG